MANIWIQAARPKTLFVSIAPVIVAVAMALGSGIKFSPLPAVICLIFAVMAQIISNFVNDYADGVKGADDESRIGPKRMVASGQITKGAMLRALVITSIVTALLGLSLIYWGGWILLPVGLIVFVGAYSYSAGPFPLSYHGLGDVAVILFYGFVPVVFTYYVLIGEICSDICLAGLAMGLIADELLLVNNYRDVEQDKLHNKKTIVVLFGKRFAEIAFLINPFVALSLGFFFIPNLILWIPLSVAFALFSTHLWLKLRKTSGPSLNHLLAKSSALSIIFAAMVLVAEVF